MGTAAILATVLALGAPDSQALAFRGGLELQSQSEGFGGFSGLVMAGDCTGITAVSDDGWWLTAALTYDAQGRLSGTDAGELLALLGPKGERPSAKPGRDAEALLRLPDGKFVVGYESRARLESFTDVQAPSRPVAMPKEIAQGPENGELEALTFVAGSFLAVAEENRDAQGRPLGWLWQGSQKPTRFSITIPEGLAVTDAAALPDDDGVLLLARSFFPGFSRMAILRIKASEIGEGAVVKAETLFEAQGPYANVDNMEGLGVCQRDGETRLSVISDDNYLPSLQRTVIFQFALKP